MIDSMMIKNNSGNNLIDKWLGSSRIQWLYPEDWLDLDYINEMGEETIEEEE